MVRHRTVCLLFFFGMPACCAQLASSGSLFPENRLGGGFFKKSRKLFFQTGERCRTTKNPVVPSLPSPSPGAALTSSYPVLLLEVLLLPSAAAAFAPAPPLAGMDLVWGAPLCVQGSTCDFTVFSGEHFLWRNIFRHGRLTDRSVALKTSRSTN